MVRKDHLSIVPDPETGANKGIVTVRTAGTKELIRWLRRGSRNDWLSLEDVPLPDFYPLCEIDGQISMHETNGNWIKSYIGPVTDEDRLPANAEMEQALSAHCNLTRPEGPTGMDLELKSEQGVTTVDVHPTLWQIRTDFDPSNPLMFPHRFSTHKTVLQGVIETLIASQRNASGPKKTTGSYLKTCI